MLILRLSLPRTPALLRYRIFQSALSVLLSLLSKQNAKRSRQELVKVTIFY